MRTAAAAVLIACLALLGVSAPVSAEERPDWLKKDTLDRLFPGVAAYTGPKSGKPTAFPVISAGRTIGFVFSTADMTDIVGFSGLPFNLVVGLDMQGKIVGVVVAEHHEPILDYGSMVGQVPRFIKQYTGLDLGRSISFGQGTPGSINGISGATVSARAFNQAILQSARLVAHSRGLAAGGGSSAMIDTSSFNPLTWQELIANGSIARMQIPVRGRAGAGSDAATNGPAVALDLYAAVVNPASIGRNLLGGARYTENVAVHGPQDLIVLVMGKGPWSFVGTRVFETGTFDRIRIEQGAHKFELLRAPRQFQYLPFVSAKGAPKFDEIYLFRIPVEKGIDILAPWQLVVTGEGAQKPEFKLGYKLPSQYILPPAPPSAEEPEASWKAGWRAQAKNLVVLGVSLLVLTVLLVAMHRLTPHARLYEALRIGFLLFTLVWMGWIAGAQLSIINVFAWLSGLIHGNGVAVLLADPLLCVLLAFVLVSFVVWGRGVFCGWLCPFGALQELLAKLARVVRLPQWSPSFRTHRRLWPLKYVSLAVLTLAALHGLQTMAVAAEIEPFKTVISLHMERTWPYVAFALVILAAGLFVERAFCRFLCPLGAVMAIGGRLRLRRFTTLKRRPECGSPCQLCARRCPIQAIEPSGKINMDECFYCLDCQVIHDDATVCPPLVYEAKRNRKFGGVGATGSPAAG
ncbi:MAG TPA: 4Fe-4S binding protein [Dehalococcoidia bacterium]|nr:4Fe-4S binding protein [Dehalococcoidia bacterium]